MAPPNQADQGESSSDTFEGTGVWSREDFKSKKRKKAWGSGSNGGIQSFKKQLDHFTKLHKQRQMGADDEKKRAECERLGIEYEPPVPGESASDCFKHMPENH